MDKIDTTEPDGKWQFDDNVASVFDDMLARSIPQYEVMRQAVTDLGLRYTQPDTAIVDLGCSRGEALAPFVAAKTGANKFYGIETSNPMYTVAKQRFEGDCDVSIIHEDLRTFYPDIIASVTLSVLTLQFIPIEYRQRIVSKIYQHTAPGGLFILVEKVLGNTAQIDSDMVDIYYVLKGSNGYSPEQIERKRLSLEGVLVPVTARWNEELLHMSGFSQVDCFWRWMNFAGWLAVK